MSDFDWVTARSNCSLAIIFERLKASVQEDVAKRQELTPKSEFGYRYGFRTDLGPNRISVVLEGPAVTEPESLVFYLRKDSIEVVDGKGALKFKATPTINDEGECRLKVAGQEKDLWQFRKMVLEDLLFGRV